MDKSPDAFRTISEVAEDLDLPQHVLRFWETRFSQIKPLKRGGGRRYYRPDDVDLLKGIRYYLYGEGYTIKGAQRILKERGVRHVTDLGRAQSENYAPPVATIPKADELERRRERDDWPEATPLSASSFTQAIPGDTPGGVMQAEHGHMQAEHGHMQILAAGRPLSRANHAIATEAVPAPGLDRKAVRTLHAVLADLVECKRILDAAGKAG